MRNRETLKWPQLDRRKTMGLAVGVVGAVRECLGVIGGGRGRGVLT